jgi:hypothetical protein
VTSTPKAITLWQKSIGLTIAGIFLFWVAIAASVCPPAFHAPVVIALISLVMISLGTILNLRANIGDGLINKARMAFLGAVQISTLCFEIWVLARTKA